MLGTSVLYGKLSPSAIADKRTHRKLRRQVEIATIKTIPETPTGGFPIESGHDRNWLSCASGAGSTPAGEPAMQRPLLGRPAQRINQAQVPTGSIASLASSLMARIAIHGTEADSASRRIAAVSMSTAAPGLSEEIGFLHSGGHDNLAGVDLATDRAWESRDRFRGVDDNIATPKRRIESASQPRRDEPVAGRLAPIEREYAFPARQSALAR